MLDNLATELAAEPAVLDIHAARQRRDALDRPPTLPLGDAIRRAALETGSGTAWLSGLWQCARGPGKLTAAEYFYYRLYDSRHSADELARFVGKGQQTTMHFACNDQRWFAPSIDKLFFLSAMTGAGVPVPELMAVFDPSGRRCHAKAITDAKAMAAFLDQAENYPLFAKPIDGMYSVGALALTDGADGRIHLRGAGQVTSSEVVDFMAELSPEGYIIQRTLAPAPVLADAFGGTLSTVRLLVLTGEGGPQVESAVIKIPRSETVADNYWRDGNMLGAVDLGTGRIVRAVTGTGPSLRTVQTHPDTGRELIGMELPDWKAAVNLAERAAGTLPGIKTQSWDIALTRRGPVAIEVNWGGDLNLHQLAHNRGALTDGFCAHLRRHGYRGPLPG